MSAPPTAAVRERSGARRVAPVVPHAGEQPAPTGGEPASTRPLVLLQDAGVRFPGSPPVEALLGVTCAVRPRARLALVGPSGSGKSTLLHLMSGLQDPSSGTVSWPGLAGSARQPGMVGMVFQAPSLMAPLDVRENVALPLLLAGASHANAAERAEEVLAALGLTALAEQLPEELSGGQAQRVAVARALGPRPRLVLADEPTGQLDHATADLVLDVLLDALPGDAALVLSTHDSRIADRLEETWHVRDGVLLDASREPV